LRCSTLDFCLGGQRRETQTQRFAPQSVSWHKRNSVALGDISNTQNFGRVSRVKSPARLMSSTGRCLGRPLFGFQTRLRDANRFSWSTFRMRALVMVEECRLEPRCDRLRVGWLTRISFGRGTQDKKMSNDHLPRVVYHQSWGGTQDKKISKDHLPRAADHQVY